jgi:SSS family solute:Na+ symporter
MQFPTLHPIDLALIVLYLVANASIGFISFRKNRGKSSEAEEYLLAGRTLTLPAFVATLVSTWYGGIIAIGEYSYDNGIVTWIVFGVPYYVAALIFALVLAKRVNSNRQDASIADRLRSSYGPTAGYLGAVASFFMTSPASYIIMLATLYEWFFGLNYAWGVTIAIASSIIYLFYGGFRASIRADMLQFIMMFVGFAIILPFAYSTFGGIDTVLRSVPASHTKPFGDYGLGYILIWYVAALTTLVDPNFHSRVFAARSPKVARNGILVSIGFWILFDFMTNLAGLYAKMATPALADSRFAYPTLAEAVLPIGAKGLFYVGMLSTVLSTVDSFFFTSASIFGRDILWRLSGRGEEQVKKYIRIGLVVTALAALPIILFTTRIYNVWYSMGSVLVPVLILPLTISYLKRDLISKGSVPISMLLSGAVALAQYIFGQAHLNAAEPQYVLGIEPMYSGLIASVIVTVIDVLLRLRRSSRA